MLTKIMKWVCISALLLAVIWRSSANYQILLEFLVCLGAVLVVLRAWRMGKYPWAAGFVAIAVLFNPIAPIGRRVIRQHASEGQSVSSSIPPESEGRGPVVRAPASLKCDLNHRLAADNP
jgi:hypothetical protein